MPLDGSTDWITPIRPRDRDGIRNCLSTNSSPSIIFLRLIPIIW